MTGKQAEENKPVSAEQESAGVQNFKERREQIKAKVKLGSEFGLLGERCTSEPPPSQPSPRSQGSCCF